MKTRKELKEEARRTLAGNWLTAIKVSIVPIIFQVLAGILATIVIAALVMLARHLYASGGFSSASDSFSAHDSNFASHGGSGIENLVTTYLLLGVNFTFIDWLRTKKVPERPFRDAFQTISGRYFLPVLVLYILQAVLTFLWTLLLVIPGIIKTFSYSQTYYIYKDVKAAGGTDDRNYFDYITMSRQLMDGHKMEIFILKLSFLGWDIIGWITMGIGFIWITPYKQMTYMNYYRYLVGDKYKNWGSQDADQPINID